MSERRKARLRNEVDRKDELLLEGGWALLLRESWSLRELMLGRGLRVNAMQAPPPTEEFSLQLQ